MAKGGTKMKNKCEDKIDKYCRQAIAYKKYAEVRRCDKCCIGCMEPCGNICEKALENMKED